MNKTIYILIFLISCNQNKSEQSDLNSTTTVKSEQSNFEILLQSKETISQVETTQIRLRKIAPDYFQIHQQDFNKYKNDNSKWFFDPVKNNRLYFVLYTDYSITTAVLTSSELTDNNLIKLLGGIKITDLDNTIKLKKIKSEKGVELGLTKNEVEKIFGEPDTQEKSGVKEYLKWKFEMNDDYDLKQQFGELRPFILSGLKFNIEMEFIEQKLTKLVYRYEVP